MLKKWVIAIRIENFVPSKHSHMRKTDYSPGSRDQLETSVPIVFNFPDHLQKVENYRRPLIRKQNAGDNSKSSSSDPCSRTNELRKRKISSTRDELKENIGKQRAKIMTVNKKIRRKEKKVINLNEMINDLREKILAIDASRYSLYSFVLLCTPLYSFVLLCTPLYSFVLLCTAMYSFVLLCTPLYSFLLLVLLCTPLYSFVLLCTPLYSFRKSLILFYV